LLVIFRTGFAEDFGYYFGDPDDPLPDQVAPFAERVEPGVYRFYDPG